MTVAGELEVLGRLVGASNQTFLVTDESGGTWVYKPVAGEAPLWDFPDGTLGRREVAAHAISEHLGLGTVPLTVWGEGPFGEGSLQRFVDGEISSLVDLVPAEELTAAWLPIATGMGEDGRPVVLVHRDDHRLRGLALFDVLVNNSDRKAGHIIQAGEAVYGVDHGVTMHVDDKLRTVLWGFAGAPLTEQEVDVARLASRVAAPLSDGLHDDEWLAFVRRAEALCATGVFPEPTGQWPAIPWPPF